MSTGTGGGEARLFSAVLPPQPVVASLRRELDRHPDEYGEGPLRWNTATQWHITLGFYGIDNIAARADWLRRRLTGRPAPRLRLEAAGTFRGVLWAGVHSAGLAELAALARPEGDRRDFRAHLTLARGAPQSALIAWQQLLATYRSPEWTATEVVLMRSDQGHDRGSGPRYTTVERVPLGAPGTSGHASRMSC